MARSWDPFKNLLWTELECIPVSDSSANQIALSAIVTGFAI